MVEKLRNLHKTNGNGMYIVGAYWHISSYAKHIYGMKFFTRDDRWDWLGLECSIILIEYAKGKSVCRMIALVQAANQWFREEWHFSQYHIFLYQYM